MKKKQSLNRYMLFMMLGAYSVVLILLLFLDFYSINNYHRTIRNEWNSILYHYSYILENHFSELSNESYSIYSSDGSFRELSKQNNDAVYNYTNAKQLEERLLGLLTQNSQVNGYFLFYSDMSKCNTLRQFSVISHEEMTRVRELLEENLPAHGNGRFWYYWTIDGKAVAVSVTKRNSVSACLVYVMDLLTDTVEQELDREAEAFIIHEGDLLGDEGVAVSSYIGGKDISFSDMTGQYYVCGRKIGNTNLWLCMDVPVSIWDYLSGVQLGLLLLTFLTIFFCVMAYFRMRRLLVSPLHQLVEEMKEISGGDMTKEISVNADFEELQLVEETMNQTLHEVQHQKDSVYEATIEKQKAQMQYLSMQLKPHFYLNGLKTINAYAMNRNAEKIQDIIMRLSVHMRYILQIERELVLLQDEIDYVNNYVQLRRDMTDRPIELQWNLQQNMECSWKVPTLCLQTFVENSTKYAKLKSGENTLRIAVSVNELKTEDGMFLDMIVSDNGEGYPEELLEEMNAAPEETAVGVGIHNLKRRCRILYGDRAEYVFYNDGGAVSELIIPLGRETTYLI